MRQPVFDSVPKKRRSQEGKEHLSSGKRSSLTIKSGRDVSFRPPSSVLALSALLMLLRRQRLLVAVFGSWLLIKASHAFVASELFQTRLLLLQFTRTWPPCDLDKPSKPQKLPLLLRWLDWLPFVPDDVKSFPGIAHCRPVDGLKKRKIGAWLVEPSGGPLGSAQKKRKGLVLHFKGRSGHRGQRSLLKFYERVSREPLELHCASFDGPGSHEEAVSERNYLATAHAVWSALVKPPYSFPPESIVVWGTSFGCCSAANLCLYLMRRGTPPAALVLENPATSFPKLLASRFGFLGEDVQNRVEAFARANLIHRFDLEKRIKSICSFDTNVPILFISAENDWTVPASHAQRLASVASALAASKRVLLLSLPVTRRELLADRNFVTVTANFINQALEEAKQELNVRRLSVVDYGGSPSTWSADLAAEDRLFDDDTTLFGL